MKRYRLECPLGDRGVEMAEREDGEWVKWEDVQGLHEFMEGLKRGAREADSGEHRPLADIVSEMKRNAKAVKLRFEMGLVEPNDNVKESKTEEVMLVPERIHRHVIGMAGALLFNRTTLLKAVVKVFVPSDGSGEWQLLQTWLVYFKNDDDGTWLHTDGKLGWAMI